MFTVAASVFSLALATVANAAIGPIADLSIVNKDIAPDGFTRSTVLAGGTFPGPLIKGNKGDRFRINVVNELEDQTMDVDTSIHWHGFFQKGTNWADGVDMVTQCPIVPGHFFLYDFPVTNQAGTFWYHSHLRTQYCDGLRGPFVVYDPNDPHKSLYDIDDESTVLTIGDWYHTVSPEIVGAPQAEATLFNGLGRAINGTASPLYVMNVEQGKRYRIRLLNIACDPYFNFTIAGHTFTIIEADGENTEPLEVDMIQILSGQRYSIVLHANQPVENYWIRANPNPFSGFPGFDGGRNSAILRYKGAEIRDPTQNETTPTKPFRETDLHALENPGAPGKHDPGEADINIKLEFAVDIEKAVFTVNGTPFIPPETPVLLQILSGAHTPQELLPSDSVYTLERNKVVELTMPPLAAGGPHPIHLHGHAFSVVKSAYSNSYNWDNPVRRDTVMLGSEAGDDVVIRFVTDNPGPWFIHCHIDWHLDIGFAAVFAEDPMGTNSSNPVPEQWKDLCPLYNSTQHKENTAGKNTNLRLAIPS